jgi:hypothetical protein
MTVAGKLYKKAFHTQHSDYHRLTLAFLLLWMDCRGRKGGGREGGRERVGRELNH